MTNPAGSGWTVDTLHDLMLAMVAAVDRRNDERFAAQKEAVDKAERAADKRFDASNEFRDQLAEALASAREQLMPRQEAKLLFDSLSAQIATGQRTAAELSNVVIGLRATLAGQDTGADAAFDAAQRQADATARARTYVLGVIGAGLLALSVFFGFHKTTTTVVTNTPAATTPATTRAP